MESKTIDNSTRELVGLVFGRRLPLIGVVPPGFAGHADASPAHESADIYVASGNVGPVVSAVTALSRLAESGSRCVPVLYSLGAMELSATPAEFDMAMQLTKNTNVVFAEEHRSIDVHGIAFSGIPLGLPRLFNGEVDNERDLEVSSKRVVGHRVRHGTHTGLQRAPTRQASASRGWRNHRSKTVDSNDGEPRPGIVVSHLAPGNCADTADVARRAFERFASIGPALKLARGRARDLARVPLPGSLPPAWVHFHSGGADLPLFRVLHPWNGWEISLLAHEIATARQAANPRRPVVSTVSLADALFSIRSPNALARSCDDEGLPFLQPDLAYWCRCITRARRFLRSTRLRFAIETFPIDRLTGRSVIAVGVLVEDIDDKGRRRLTQHLSRLLDRLPPAPLLFDPIPVISLPAAQEDVRTLSNDALDAAFEAIRS